jgi:hypothetical protein
MLREWWKERPTGQDKDVPTPERVLFPGYRGKHLSSHRDKKSSKPDHECDERAEKFFLCSLSRLSDFQTRLP